MCTGLKARSTRLRYAVAIEMTRRWRQALVVLSAILVIALGVEFSQLPAVGAGGLLHPGRRHLTESPPPTCRDATFVGDDVTLKGWQCRASPAPRGTIVYLHGVADNRASGAGVIDRFGRRGCCSRWRGRSD